MSAATSAPLKLGYVPLTDSAPLIVAQELGFFEKNALNVELQKINSWATVRDKISHGLLDGAQMLSPLPLAMSLGLEPVSVEMNCAFSMGLNGNGITFSNALYEQVCQQGYTENSEPESIGNALRKYIEQRHRQTAEPLTFAVVHPFSTHNYLLRYWLNSAGIDPDKDIRMVIVPPAQMVEALNWQTIDGYCVGEPWNSLAQYQQRGKVILSGRQIWNNAPEKVFAVTRDWALKNHQQHQRIITALLEASIWCDTPENRQQLVSLLSQRAYLDLPEAVVSVALLPNATTETCSVLQNNLIFYRHAANYPWSSHAIWNLTQMIYSGQWQQQNINPNQIKALARDIYTSHIYRDVAMAMHLPVPTIITKPEGIHIKPWLLENATQPMLLGADCFIDGLQFDPDSPNAYLKTLRQSQGTVGHQP